MDNEPNTNQAPTDPFSALAQGSVALHTWYGALRDAGFTRGEALTLMAKVVAEQNRD